MPKDKSILITGGTGTFGKAFVELLLGESNVFKSILIFSRDEFKQQEMRQLYPVKKFPQVRFVLGDVRDAESLKRAFKGVDVVIHAAALKQVGTAEANPSEFAKTNIQGTENVIWAADECGVEKVILLSTDKAVNPVGMYGATKLCAEKLFLEANSFSETAFSVIRYGNIIGSRGSVLDYFLLNKDQSTIAITHEDMTRFGGNAHKLAHIVLDNLTEMVGGEILVPKLPAFKLIDLARVVNPHFSFETKGIPHGERLHELLISDTEAYEKIETKDFYILVSPFWKGNLHEYLLENQAMLLPKDFSFTTENCEQFLSEEELGELADVLQISLI